MSQILLLNFNKKYNFNISSYSREFRAESKEGNLLLQSLSKIDFVKLKELNLEYCNISDLSPLNNTIFRI